MTPLEEFQHLTSPEYLAYTGNPLTYAQTGGEHLFFRPEDLSLLPRTTAAVKEAAEPEPKDEGPGPEGQGPDGFGGGFDVPGPSLSFADFEDYKSSPHGLPAAQQQLSDLMNTPLAVNLMNTMPSALEDLKGALGIGGDDGPSGPSGATGGGGVGDPTGGPNVGGQDRGGAVGGGPGGSPPGAGPAGSAAGQAAAAAAADAFSGAASGDTGSDPGTGDPGGAPDSGAGNSGKADGGLITRGPDDPLPPPGVDPGRADNITEKLSAGEFVVPSHIVNFFGPKFFQSLISRGEEYGAMPLTRTRHITQATPAALSRPQSSLEAPPPRPNGLLRPGNGNASIDPVDAARTQRMKDYVNGRILDQLRRQR